MLRTTTGSEKASSELCFLWPLRRALSHASGALETRCGWHLLLPTVPDPAAWVSEFSGQGKGSSEAILKAHPILGKDRG